MLKKELTDLNTGECQEANGNFEKLLHSANHVSNGACWEDGGAPPQCRSFAKGHIDFHQTVASKIGQESGLHTTTNYVITQWEDDFGRCVIGQEAELEDDADCMINTSGAYSINGFEITYIATLVPLANNAAEHVSIITTPALGITL